MDTWDPSLPLPDQVADAFAVLYDWLNDRRYLKITNDRKQFLIEAGTETRDLQSLVAASDAATPDPLRVRLSDARTSGESRLREEVFRCIIAIDRAFEKHHPLYQTEWSSSAAPTPYQQWQRFGCFNTRAVNGHVLPKWTSLRRPETTLARHCRNLVRVAVERNRLTVIGRGHGTFSDRSGEERTVVIVPFLYSLDDATFSPAGEAGEQLFAIQHSCKIPPNLAARLHSAVEAIRDPKAHIAIFPELALNHVLLEALKSSLKGTLTSSSKLQWVVAGTAMPGAGEPPFHHTNMAVVLNGAGNVVGGETVDGTYVEWKQAKRHRYTLSANEQVRYGLGRCFGAPGDECDRPEAIAVDDQRFAFDDVSGRFTVLICEDWGKEIDAGADLLQLLPLAVFVIVMDGPLMEHRWAATRAREIVERIEALVVLANSLLLPNRPECLTYLRDEHGIPDPTTIPDGRQPVGRLYGPPKLVREDDSKPDEHRMFARALPDSADNRSLISGAHRLPLFNK